MLAGGVSIVHFHGVALCVFVSLSFCVLCVCAALCNCVKPRKGKLDFYQHCHLISFSSQFQQKSASLRKIPTDIQSWRAIPPFCGVSFQPKYSRPERFQLRGDSRFQMVTL